MYDRLWLRCIYMWIPRPVCGSWNAVRPQTLMRSSTIKKNGLVGVGMALCIIVGVGSEVSYAQDTVQRLS